MSVSPLVRAAVRLPRFILPLLLALAFAGPRFVPTAESAGEAEQRVYLPVVQSFAEPLVPWSAPVLVDGGSDPLMNESYPQVELDGSGNAYAVWMGGSPSRVYFSYKPAGPDTAWSVPKPVHDTGRPQFSPAVAVDAQGDFYVSWTEEGGPFLLRWSSTGEWSEPQVMPVLKGSGDFHLAADSRGRLHLLYKAWQGDYQEPIDLFYALRDETGLWHEAQQVNDRPGSLTNPNGPSSTPSLAVDGMGLAHAAWGEWQNYEWPLYYAHQLPDGSWSRNEVAARPGGSPSLAVDEAGNAYLAWSRNDFRRGEPEVYFAYRPANGVWQPSVAINETARTGRLWYEREGPSLAIDSKGAVYVIWPNGYGATAGLFFDWRPPISDDASTTEPWHMDFAISHSTKIYPYQDLAASNGGVVAVWMETIPTPGVENGVMKIMASTRR